MSNKKKQIIEGSQAIAAVINNIKPAVVSAYPITPQTHIVEKLAKLKADGEASFEYVRAESEFAAASIILGSSAAGVRVYSATSSQGLLLMSEVVFNIAGMRLPIVMTCANRAVSSPINIWNDHSDVMTIRDAGWINLFAGNNQEAVDLHILAYKIAEQLNIPVMVNVDGFILTHAYEPVIVPDAKTIKKYLPDYKPTTGNYLDPNNPITMGAFFTPAHYFETRENLHNDLLNSLSVIKKEYKSLIKILGRNNKDNGLVEYYGPKKPETILVAMGSVIGTVREAIISDEKYKNKVGVLKIKTYRPFPSEEINKILNRAKNVAVIEKALSLGSAGPLFSDIKTSLVNHKLNLSNYIVGLGGRDVTEKMIKEIIISAKKNNKVIKFIAKI
ncbi:MAG: pyruvate ferredoxin oxidoreductase [Patescibacteria group bacterium]